MHSHSIQIHAFAAQQTKRFWRAMKKGIIRVDLIYFRCDACTFLVEHIGLFTHSTQYYSYYDAQSKWHDKNIYLFNHEKQLSQSHSQHNQQKLLTTKKLNFISTAAWFCAQFMLYDAWNRIQNFIAFQPAIMAYEIRKQK